MDPTTPQTVLSFSASLISNNRDDQLRDFIVTYTIEDQSFSVIEKVVPNSGFPGGRFLQKMRIANPETGEPYEPSDLMIGTDICLNGWKFHLYDASEGTLRKMETLSDTFKQSNLDEIMAKLGNQIRSRFNDFKTQILRSDRQKRGRIPKEQLFDALEQIGVELEPQEKITIFRHFQFADSNLFEYTKFIQLLE